MKIGILATLAFCAAGFAGVDEAESKIIEKYLAATEVQQSALRGTQATLEIRAGMSRLRRQAAVRVLRTVSRAGQITYETLDSSGDGLVRREVIGRYLSADTETRDRGGIAITPANYQFRVKGVRQLENRAVYVIRITPHKDRKGLFKGEIWLDPETGMPLLETGEFVKMYSKLVRSIRFTRSYDLQSGIAVTRSIDTTVETRFFGLAELKVEFASAHRELRRPAQVHESENEQRGEHVHQPVGFAKFAAQDAQ